MKPLSKLALSAAFTAAAAALSSQALAAPVTIVSTSPTWGNAVGGSSIVYNSANGAYTDVRWGESQGSGQSGLGFDPVNPPAAAYPTDTVFKLGDLRHYNNPIAGGSAATSVDLALQTTIGGSASPATQLFAFRFLIDETPNATPCAYPSTTPCADKITFVNQDLTSSFMLDGVSYTLALTGFSLDGGQTFTSDFISQEGGTNVAGLYAKFTAAQVPEPGSLALLGLGLAGLAAASRRRRQ